MIRWLPLLLILVGCGIKAAPQPPGMPGAKRGEPTPPCAGCEIPTPDSYPSPSMPVKTEDLPPVGRPETEPVLPGEEAGTAGAGGGGAGGIGGQGGE